MEKLSSKQNYYEKVANTIIQNLNKRQIEGFYCKNRKEALKKVLELIPKGASIGWGGSVTLAETEILEAVKKCFNYNRNK